MPRIKDENLPEVVLEPSVSRTKTVIVRRPQGNKDEGILLGFNNDKTYFTFDKPTDAAAELVDYYRKQMVSEVTADPAGQPVVTQYPFLTISDA